MTAPAPVARERRRLMLGGFIVLAWLAGLGALARRELYRPASDRLAEAAMRISPGATFYVVEQGGRQIGFASSTLDTATTGFELIDYFVADVPMAGALHRATAQSTVHLSRRLALTNFDVGVETEGGPLRVRGRAEGDTALSYTVSSGQDGAPTTQRLTLSTPIVLPTVVPLAVALGGKPAVGRTTSVRVFDPVAMAPKDVRIKLEAESLFVVPDSAVLDSATRRWKAAHTDTVRAWRLSSDNGTIAGWVDEQGRLVQAVQLGTFVLRRTAYELAFENWRIETQQHGRDITADDDVLEQSAIAANAPIHNEIVEKLRVRLRNVELSGYDLAGGRQQLAGDTLTVTRESRDSLKPGSAGFQLPANRATRSQFARELAPEPLLQSGDWNIVMKAIRIAGDSHDPVVVAERIEKWVYDSLHKEITVGIPNALEVLRTRRGDCNEHTQLYLALARAIGLPARPAAGLARVRDKFYYHAWPEVWLGRWVAVDPTFGEFPADAAHLRFVTGGLARQAELLRLIGALQVDVVESR